MKQQVGLFKKCLLPATLNINAPEKEVQHLFHFGRKVINCSTVRNFCLIHVLQQYVIKKNEFKLYQGIVGFVWGWKLLNTYFHVP